MKRTLLMLLIMAASPAMAQTAVLLRADTLRAEPFADAKPVAQAAAGDSFRIVEQKATWSLVEKNGQRGWVRGLNLKSAGSAPVKAEGVAALQTGRQVQGGLAVPLAVRGIGPVGAASQMFKQLFDRRDRALPVRVSAGQSADGSLKVTLDSSRSGYAYVFLAGEGNTIRCLYPNAAQPDADFAAGKTLSISDNVARDPAGRTREGVKVLALLTERPIDLALPDKEVEGALFQVRITAANNAQLATALSGGCAAANCPGYGAALSEVEVSR